MVNLSELILLLHDLLICNKKIIAVYEPMEESINLEMIQTSGFSINKLHDNFFGTISYLYLVYCANTNNPGGTESDIIDCIIDIYNFLSTDYDAIINIDTLVLLKTYMLIMFFAITVQKNGDIDYLINKKLEINKKYSNRKVFYFRGEDNFEYSLIPSFYRKKLFLDEITIIDDEYLKRTYKENGMLRKYNRIFNSKYGYGFLAFMQHTFAFSPFLDFTNSHIVALSFATTKIREGNDGSIYVFDTSNDVSKYRKLEKRFVVYARRRLRILDIIGDKKLFDCTYKDFEPRMRLLKNQPNDRMRYQKGIFVDFYNCFIVNGILLLPVGSEKITKYRIDYTSTKLNKLSIANKIRKQYPYYKYRALMNPYNYFKDK